MGLPRWMSIKGIEWVWKFLMWDHDSIISTIYLRVSKFQGLCTSFLWRYWLFACAFYGFFPPLSCPTSLFRYGNWSGTWVVWNWHQQEVMGWLGYGSATSMEYGMNKLLLKVVDSHSSLSTSSILLFLFLFLFFPFFLPLFFFSKFFFPPVL